MTDAHLVSDRSGNRDLFKILMLIAQGLLIPGWIWIATQIIDIRERTIRLEVQAEAQVISVQDRYTAQQAIADRRNQQQIDGTQDREIGRLEAQINAILERSRQIEGARQ